MSCRLYRQTLVDLARGAVTPADAAAAAEAHAAECPACGALLDDGRRLTSRLRALDRSTVVPTHSALEAGLGRAFDQYHGVRLRAPSWTRWVAAAAILCGVALGLWRLRSSTVPGVTGGDALRPAGQASEPSHRVASPPPVVAASQDRSATSTPRRPRTRRPDRASTAPPFVPIPAAAGLPPLESAQIFRVQVPVGALPNYGVQIEPDAIGAVVTADVLVGQDGHARAIRLVNNEHQPGSRR
jgi:hypothetical protein